ncbi:YczE/YyaS/YitT family protein [Pasteurella atlantica]|uniref:YitT family protein n=2 Tax=Pasteurellaceae TaxID=712 RepID=A0ACC6HNJ2_9PAST|nr:YitT family protein [Pasteurella atlantica]MDP8052383.1 YitT family protein [Pasteurella atlantica]MDP8099844.1 YitT family protein [Pasteurella atlantica]MDP8101660.1 YitT family protein [Pasteurella atlantica]MDP8105221.1 YitT family protein [Pasteurella atlantica]MDP8106323.1 YitT family protein [Pasteurella atlantica]
MKPNKRALIKTVWSAESSWKPKSISLIVLCISLLIFGVGDGMLVLASLGSSPWTVLAQGISLKTHVNIGVVTLLISLCVMLMWLPFKQRIGLGTILNMVLIALGLGLSVQFIAPPETMLFRLIFTVCGIVIIGIASAFYLTCHMGAGPRDGLMVGIYQLTGWKVAYIRTSIEIIVCVIGWLLGGVVGISTLLFAFVVGWILQISLYFIDVYFSKS